MKIAAIVGASVLGLALATSAPAYAQHGHDDDHHGGPQNHQDEHHGGPQGNEARNDHHQAPPQHGDYHQTNRPEARHDPRPPEHHEAYRQDVHQPHYRQATNTLAITGTKPRIRRPTMSGRASVLDIGNVNTAHGTTVEAM